MNEPKESRIALNVRLKPSESSVRPLAANYTHVGVSQGVAYVDFGFIEPALLASLAQTAKDDHAAPKGLEGHIVTRVAMPLDNLVRLHQQLQQVLMSMRAAKQPKTKTGS